MVLLGLEPRLIRYKHTVLPLNYRTIYIVRMFNIYFNHLYL
jgi:hypothetical protein